jgi:hypothetical protein
MFLPQLTNSLGHHLPVLPIRLSYDRVVDRPGFNFRDFRRVVLLPQLVDSPFPNRPQRKCSWY